MPRTIRTYAATFFDPPYASERVGSLTVPYAEATVDGADILLPAAITLAPRASRRLWTYLDFNTFTSVEIRTSGNPLWVSLVLDTPTSTTNFTPTGTRRRVRTLQISRLHPFAISSVEQPLTEPVADESAGSLGTAPPMLTDVDTVLGRIYEIWVFNPSATETRTAQGTVIA
jgi:hypothetical protein